MSTEKTADKLIEPAKTVDNQPNSDRRPNVMQNDPSVKSSPNSEDAQTKETGDDTDRPGFDLGGSTGETHAGKGLGIAAVKDRKAWKLPR